jgi:hypothetical protein
VTHKFACLYPVFWVVGTGFHFGFHLQGSNWNHKISRLFNPIQMTSWYKEGLTRTLTLSLFLFTPSFSLKGHIKHNGILTRKEPNS